MGTPLTIDEATQFRLFGTTLEFWLMLICKGIFFNSILVERESLAIPVKLEYEKHPAYCSHCKVLGDALPQCKRLNSVKLQYVKEIHHAKFQSQHAKSNIDGTKHVKNKKHESEGGLEKHQAQLEKRSF